MRGCLIKGILIVGVLALMVIAFSVGGYYGLKVGYEAGVNDTLTPDIACLTIVPEDPAMQEASDGFAARYCDLESQVRASCQSLVVTPEIQAKIDQYNADVMSAMMAGQIVRMNSGASQGAPFRLQNARVLSRGQFTGIMAAGEIYETSKFSTHTRTSCRQQGVSYGW